MGIGWKILGAVMLGGATIVIINPKVPTTLPIIPIPIGDQPMFWFLSEPSRYAFAGLIGIPGALLLIAG